MQEPKEVDWCTRCGTMLVLHDRCDIVPAVP
jgi:hypothetical protein